MAAKDILFTQCYVNTNGGVNADFVSGNAPVEDIGGPYNGGQIGQDWDTLRAEALNGFNNFVNGPTDATMTALHWAIAWAARDVAPEEVMPNDIVGVLLRFQPDDSGELLLTISRT